ncbi:MAG: hypothetical protein ACFB03_19480 [Paracoccaceae bacterium]
MGAQAWFAAYFDEDPKDVLRAKPILNRAASRELAERLIPSASLNERADGSLGFLNPDKGEVFVGDFGGLKIIAHEELGIDALSKIDPRWRSTDLGSTTYVHATHSIVDWCAFSFWQNGELIRALSLAPDSGIIEDIGDRLPFEVPYWNGAHALEDEDGEEPYPLPFHPLDLSASALLDVLGFQFEGRPSDWVCDPMDVPIAHFEIR